jgi:hypothetical protein
MFIKPALATTHLLMIEPLVEANALVDAWRKRQQAYTPAVLYAAPRHNENRSQTRYNSFKGLQLRITSIYNHWSVIIERNYKISSLKKRVVAKDTHNRS